MMISRLVLSLRKVNNQTKDTSEWMSRSLSFAPNCELSARIQSQVERPGPHSGGTTFSSDFRYSCIIIQHFTISYLPLVIR